MRRGAAVTGRGCRGGGHDSISPVSSIAFPSGAVGADAGRGCDCINRLLRTGVRMIWLEFQIPVSAAECPIATQANEAATISPARFRTDTRGFNNQLRIAIAQILQSMSNLVLS